MLAGSESFINIVKGGTGTAERALTRVLANFSANAFACGTSERALLATHHSIPVVQFFALLSSFIACFNMVLLLHVTARSTWADAGRVFRKRLRV